MSEEILADAETYERLSMMADHPEYAAMMKCRLEVQTTNLGIDLKSADEWDGTEIWLSEADVEILDAADDNGARGNDFARVISVQTDDAMVRLEADHRGPDHGWDGWIGEDDHPEAVVTDIALKGVQSDD